MIDYLIKQYILLSYSMSYKKYKNTPIKMEKDCLTDSQIKNKAFNLNKKWEYIYDPVFGAVNLIVNPNVDITKGDCDDFAATLYAQIGEREKYLVHIITKDLTKCHTIPIYKSKNGWTYVDWSKVTEIKNLSELQQKLSGAYDIRFLDFAAFDESNKKWFRVNPL